MKRENGEQVSYDPRRLHGVTLYRETERAFSEGDRVQLTAANREQHIANRELGTIEKIGARFIVPFPTGCPRCRFCVLVVLFCLLSSPDNHRCFCVVRPEMIGSDGT